jgi:RNase adaptor protein for sRNA GlmZ degradation
MRSQPSPQAPGAAGVTITSFGYIHAAPPAAHVIIDVRHHFRDPHLDPALRDLDASDGRVYAVVLETPGVFDLVMAAASAAAAFLSGPVPGPACVAIGCAGGRHRAPAIAIATSLVLADWGITACVGHITRPVVARDAQAAGSVA